MSKHLPGPWRLKQGDRTTIEADSGEPDSPYVVAKTHTSPFAPLIPIAVANARLISAAPDLLAVCQEAIRLRDLVREGRPDCADPDCQFCRHFDALRAAVSKSTGKVEI